MKSANASDGIASKIARCGASSPGSDRCPASIDLFLFGTTGTVEGTPAR
jgi:hypothetical protein